MIGEEEVYRIGQLTRAHGVRGELAFAYTDDVWERSECPYLVVRVDGILVPFFIEGRRTRSATTALVKLAGCDSAAEAALLRGAGVYFPKALTPRRADGGERPWRSLTGYRLVDEERGEVGVVDSVDESTSNVLLSVGGRLVPAAAELVTDVDDRERVLTMRLPEGLLDL